jgi:hypothetical protein
MAYNAAVEGRGGRKVAPGDELPTTNYQLPTTNYNTPQFDAAVFAPASRFFFSKYF